MQIKSINTFSSCSQCLKFLCCASEMMAVQLSPTNDCLLQQRKCILIFYAHLHGHFLYRSVNQSMLNKILSHLAGFLFVRVFCLSFFFVFLKNNVSFAYLFGERLFSGRVLQMKPLLIHQWRGAEQPHGSSLFPLPGLPCLLQAALLTVLPCAFVLGVGHCHSLGLDLMMGDGTCRLIVTEFIFLFFCSFSG